MAELNLDLGTKITIKVSKKIQDKIKNNKSSHYDCSKNLIKNSFFETSKKVPNVYRGKLIYDKIKGKYNFQEHKNKGSYTGSRFNDYCISKDKEIPSIVIILESPHRDEYDNDFNPIVPANGRTGKIMKSKIEDIFKNLTDAEGSILKNEEYRVIIVNPIPYQTSLYELYKERIVKGLRNEVWLACWNNITNIKKDFSKTITDISPIVVLNCCTDFLKSQVTTELNAMNLKEVIRYKAQHPCRWNIDKNISKDM